MWPHTTRVMPWLLAAFLVVLWLFPLDAVTVRSGAPVDLTADRLLLIPLVVLWVVTLATAGHSGPRLRSSPLNVAVLAFLAVAVLSVALNAETLVNLDDFSLAVKKLLLLASYAVFFFLVSTVVRPGEIRSFLKLTIGLACLTALGVILEYRTGSNPFFDVAARLPGPIDVEPDIAAVDSLGRGSVNGPTEHGLAAATILTVACAFAFAGYFEARERKRRLLALLAIGILLTGALATLRKTSIVVPAAALLVLLAYWPRAMVRLVPAAVALLVLVQLAAPGALGSVRDQLRPDQIFATASSEGRKADFPVVAAEFRSHPIIGRGFDTYDARQYRFLDNQLFQLVIGTGALGLLTFLGMIGIAVAVAHQAARRRAGPHRPVAIAIVAGLVAFAVSNVLFDALAFAQVPYVFFFLCGLAAVIGATRGDPAARPQPLR